MDFKVAGHREKQGVMRLARMQGLGGDSQNFIYQAISTRNCYVAVEGAEVVGYGVLDYSFFDNGFVKLLFVDPEHRRRGAARGLLRHMESVCKTKKLFASAGYSNDAMKSLMADLEYESSGVIENVGEHGEAQMLYLTWPVEAV